uniref:HNH nuclease domain-containing protein n=1 Tax=Solanum lycopersicum TaxID=4081 RepID=A0A3Q7JXD6_SOLLC
DGEIITEELGLFEISPKTNPRSFPYSVKQQCWDKAEKVKGRDLDRWRRDPLGNTIFRKLVGCPGCLCHDYDHIIPYSKYSRFNPSKMRGNSTDNLMICTNTGHSYWLIMQHMH